MTKIALTPNASGTGTFTIQSPNSDTDRTLTLPDAAGEVVVNEGGGTFKIDSSGNVGIGTSSPSYKLDVESNAARFGTTSTGYAQFAKNGTASNNWHIGAEGDGTFRFYNGNYGFGTEKIRLDSSAKLAINTTSTTIAGKTHQVAISSTLPSLGLGVPGTAPANMIVFHNGNGEVGYINTDGSSTVYATSSDYRLKEDVQPMVGSVDRLMALKPVNFAWKADGSRVDGFLAHEAQEVVPEAVTGEKDAVDADGKPQYQGIDQSKLVPLLTAALQEALTKIDQLEARVAQLEGASA